MSTFQRDTVEGKERPTAEVACWVQGAAGMPANSGHTVASLWWSAIGNK
ncbi:MAG: hypothetical protein KHX13_05235 [Acidaminococcus intestini]|uniref:Uncharacterized protein n=1 Tax=Acidaminococcus intestini TaxID=187327 RepID=A0A943EK00_9FIRM|nr:hypothetical protein [Acidaminococcus intestini]